jgi:hypothetical protein
MRKCPMSYGSRMRGIANKLPITAGSNPFCWYQPLNRLGEYGRGDHGRSSGAMKLRSIDAQAPALQLVDLLR